MEGYSSSSPRTHSSDGGMSEGTMLQRVLHIPQLLVAESAAPSRQASADSHRHDRRSSRGQSMGTGSAKDTS